MLRAWGLDPLAGLGVTVAQDYEGDQFTFFKYLHEDLERLYGVVVGELSIWHALEEQHRRAGAAGAAGAGGGGWLLPARHARHILSHAAHQDDDRRRCHGPRRRKRLTYFHNVGHYELTGEDYAGVFRRLPGQDAVDDVLPPYVEFVRAPLAAIAGRRADRGGGGSCCAGTCGRRPDENPIRALPRGFRATRWTG